MAAMVTRFAPSPTGPLHLGHGYCAVRVHDLARAAGGRFVLRIDDIDGGRSRPEFVQGALDSLRWMGLDWDGEPVYQSAHLVHYQRALDDLRTKGLVYACFCTRSDIAASLSAPHGPSGILYPGTCRDLNAEEQRRRCSNEPHCWRLDMAKAAAWVAAQGIGPLIWQESGDGNISGLGEHLADPMAHGDIVLARKDAPASYHLASTVDDAMMGITHVVRGADLRQSTDIHRLLQALLGYETPQYHHHKLIFGPDGRRLAKRDNAAALDCWKETAMEGRELADQLRHDKLPTGYSFGKA
jgi:glutamyl-Q tRNA(Asp) synthetase